MIHLLSTCHRLLGALALGAATLLGLSLAAPALAALSPQGTPVTLVADRIEYDTQTGVVTADGHVRVTRGEDSIAADHLMGNLQAEEIEAAGHVTLVQGTRTATGESLRYNFRTRIGRIEKVVTQYGPWHVESESMETSGGQGVALGASVTPCDPQHPAFRVRARRVVVVPDDRLTAYDAALYVYGVRVVTLPEYTESLKPGRRARSGPAIGYNSLDGAWIEYAQFFPLGDAYEQVRVRYGARSSLSGESITVLPAADHVWSLHLGRTQTFDQSGNLFNLDRYSLELGYNPARLGSWLASYAIGGNVGSYTESQTGVSTTRGEAEVTLSTDVLRLSPSLTWSVSGQARADVYGVGQQRTVLGYTVGITDALNPSNSLTLTYNFASVVGTTPFQFDAVSSDSTVTLSYSYTSYAPSFLQSAGVSVGYSFLTQQTTLGPNVALAVSPQILFSASGSYSLTLQQWTEVDYAVNARCDCVSVGVLFRTFPQTPSQNQLFVTIGVTPFPETFTTVKF